MSLTLIFLNFFPSHSFHLDGQFALSLEFCHSLGLSHKGRTYIYHISHRSLIPVQTLMMPLILCGPSLYFHLAAINLQTLGGKHRSFFFKAVSSLEVQASFCFIEDSSSSLWMDPRRAADGQPRVNKLGFCEFEEVQLLYSQSPDTLSYDISNKTSKQT